MIENLENNGWKLHSILRYSEYTKKDRDKIVSEMEQKKIKIYPLATKTSLLLYVKK